MHMINMGVDTMHTKDRFTLAVRWVCFMVLLTATVLRLASEPALRTGLRQRAVQMLGDARVTKLMLALGFGDVPEQLAPEAPAEEEPAALAAEYPTLYYQIPAEPEPNAPATEVKIRNRSGLEIDIAALMAEPLVFDRTAAGPQILILHTHATEAYTVADGDDYVASSAYRTKDTNYNMVRVGQALTDTLNARGIETLHDTTLIDWPSYNDSYSRMAVVAEQYLEQYPSIQMIIDVHRDAAEDEEGNQIAVTAEENGETYAQLLFVMGTNASGLEHPNWRKNLSCALQLQALTEQRYPDLFREMSLRSERYNQHLTPCSLLLEVGTAGNTLQQAVRSAELFGNVLADLLDSSSGAVR